MAAVSGYATRAYSNRRSLGHSSCTLTAIQLRISLTSPAALAYGLARNHPFVDGDKRTAAVGCEAFIELNDATLEANDLELFPSYLALAEGKLSERDFASWLRERLRLGERGEVHEARKPYRAKRRATSRTQARVAR